MDFHGTLFFSNNRVSHIEGSFVVGFEQSFQIKSRNQSVVIGIINFFGFFIV